MCDHKSTLSVNLALTRGHPTPDDNENQALVFVFRHVKKRHLNEIMTNKKSFLN